MAEERSWAGPSEEDPTYRLLVDCNQLAVDIDNEIAIVHIFMRDKYKCVPASNPLHPCKRCAISSVHLHVSCQSAHVTHACAPGPAVAHHFVAGVEALSCSPSRSKFPELESLVHHPIDYARVVKAIGNEMDITLIDTLEDILPQVSGIPDRADVLGGCAASLHRGTACRALLQ